MSVLCSEAEQSVSGPHFNGSERGLVVYRSTVVVSLAFVLLMSAL
jgi:hypothetical protein